MITVTTEMGASLTAQQWAHLRGIAEAEAKFMTGQVARLQDIAHLAAQQEAGTLTPEETTHLAALKAAYVRVERTNRAAIEDEREAILTDRPRNWVDPKRLAEQPDLLQRWVRSVLRTPQS